MTDRYIQHLLSSMNGLRITRIEVIRPLNETKRLFGIYLLSTSDPNTHKPISVASTLEQAIRSARWLEKWLAGD
jgi:hypothetical protein